MATIAAYHGGAIPKLGDFVRSVIPTGPQNGMTVYRIEPDGTLAVYEDITHDVRIIPARHLALVYRAPFLRYGRRAA